MTETAAGSDLPTSHQLTDQEKALRDWLRVHERVDAAGHWWMVVKAGFRRSYELGLEDARRESTKIELPSGGGGPAPATGPRCPMDCEHHHETIVTPEGVADRIVDDEWLLVEDEDGAPYPEHVQVALRRIHNHLLAVDGPPSLLTIEHMAPVLLELLPDGEPEWTPGRWWRSIGPDGDLWGESSNEAEVRSMARPGDRIQRLYTCQRGEWRDA